MVQNKVKTIQWYTYMHYITACLHIQRSCTKIISIMCRVMEFANADVCWCLLMLASCNHDSLFTKFTKLSVNKSQSYGICYTFAVWNIGVDSYYENVTLVHCSVAVCIHVLPFLLYLKEYVVISNTVSCYWQERWGLQAQTHC